MLPGTINIAGTNVTIAVSIIVAAIASAGFGWLNDRVLWRPLRHRGT
jgi:branched-subunit amino acid ABC-type transport system permease component